MTGRATLLALCRRIVPAAFEPDNLAATRALPDLVEARIAALDPAKARQIEDFLSFLGRRTAALLIARSPIRFTDASPSAQDRFLRRWEGHPSVRLRGAFQGLRRLILWTWWATADPRTSIGWLGPLHLRAPVLGWEGPLSGEPVPGEPVLRRAAGGDVSPSGGEVPARGLPCIDGDTVRADVCVVGSGAGGSVVAALLAEAGLDVVVVEEGSSWSPPDSDEEEATMVPRLYAERGTRATEDNAITLLQGECLGGGTTINWMLMLRPPMHVMEEWERAFGATLLGPASLVPALERIEQEVGAALLPSDAHSAQNRALLDGATRLGWRVEEARINARGCIRAGTCGLGCRWGAKQSATETFLPRARAAGARILCNARADRIEAPSRRGALRRVHIDNVDVTTVRGRFSVEARIVVLAAGAVGTPTILERSGLAGGGVGRYLRLHPTTAVVGQYATDMYGGAGIPQSTVCTEFLNNGDGFGFWIECPPFQPALAAAALPGFGAAHADRMRAYRKMGAFIVLVRDGAPPARDRSQGDIRAARTGPPRIRYRLGKQDWSRLANGVAAATRIHLAAGAASATALHVGAEAVTTERAARSLAHRRFGPNRISLFSAHVNGTCRMGQDPASTGCDPEGGRHGVEGVFIADGSIFPSAPAANPQAAIMAAASLIARGILDRA